MQLDPVLAEQNLGVVTAVRGIALTPMQGLARGMSVTELSSASRLTLELAMGRSRVNSILSEGRLQSGNSEGPQCKAGVPPAKLDIQINARNPR